jgi:serine/threonine-protein kinase
MGEVFLAEHRELGREFVVKVLHEELARDAQLVDRMRVEAQALGRLNHPNVVAVMGFGATQDQRPYLVMERLKGRTLEEELRARGRLPLFEAVDLMRQLLLGLEAAHSIGLVHRDIKPANLFLCGAPAGGRELKVLDFGVARVLPNAPTGAPQPLTLETEVGVLMGTPRFASPEAALGLRVDTRADIYSAALVFYVMLAGRGPFDHVESTAFMLAAHAHDEPAPPSRFAEELIPAAVDQLVLRGLRKDPEQRFQTALEFRTELERAAHNVPRPINSATTAALTLTEADLAQLLHAAPAPAGTLLSRDGHGPVLLRARESTPPSPRPESVPSVHLDTTRFNPMPTSTLVSQATEELTSSNAPRNDARAASTMSLLSMLIGVVVAVLTALTVSSLLRL